MSSIATKQTKVIHPGAKVKSKRIRRGLRSAIRQKEAGKHRLRVLKSGLHTSAQLIGPGGEIKASASTMEKAFKAGHGANVKAATWVGAELASRAKAAGVTEVVFDRAGYLYHGRVKALAEAARAGGLVF